MCLLIVKPAGKVVPTRYLVEADRCNPDGSGFCYAERGEIVVKKSMVFQETLDSLLTHMDKKLVIHFRRASIGAKVVENCHPFLFVGGQYALAHNGHISGLGEANGISDTRDLVESYLTPLLANWPNLDSPALQWWIDKAIGSGKVAILDWKGDVWIWGKDSPVCVEEDEVWYSNSSHLPTPVWTPPLQWQQTAFDCCPRPFREQSDNKRRKKYKALSQETTYYRTVGGVLKKFKADAEGNLVEVVEGGKGGPKAQRGRLPHKPQWMVEEEDAWDTYLAGL